MSPWTENAHLSDSPLFQKYKLSLQLFIDCLWCSRESVYFQNNRFSEKWAFILGATGFRSNGSFSGLLGFWNNGSLEQWADTKCTVSGNEFGKSIVFTNPIRSRKEELTLAYSLLASYTVDELCFTFLGFSECLQQETTQSISTNLYPSQRVYIQWPVQT